MVNHHILHQYRVPYWYLDSGIPLEEYLGDIPREAEIETDFPPTMHIDSWYKRIQRYSVLEIGDKEWYNDMGPGRHHHSIPPRSSTRCHFHPLLLQYQVSSLSTSPQVGKVMITDLRHDIEWTQTWDLRHDIDWVWWGIPTAPNQVFQASTVLYREVHVRHLQIRVSEF